MQPALRDNGSQINGFQQDPSIRNHEALRAGTAVEEG